MSLTALVSWYWRLIGLREHIGLTCPGRRTAIDDQRRASNIGRVIRCQKCDRPRDFDRLSKATHCNRPLVKLPRASTARGDRPCRPHGRLFSDDYRPIKGKSKPTVVRAPLMSFTRFEQYPSCVTCGTRHIERDIYDHILLTTDHLALAKLDEDRSCVQSMVQRRLFGVAQAAGIDAGIAQAEGFAIDAPAAYRTHAAHMTKQRMPSVKMMDGASHFMAAPLWTHASCRPPWPNGRFVRPAGDAPKETFAIIDFATGLHG
ncbi:hypothetical protein BH10PSE12_BH10PSE12_17560 [soil metagenome]